jgi:hypothetical protein
MTVGFMFPPTLLNPGKLFPSYLVDIDQVNPSALWKKREKKFRTFDPPPKLEPRAKDMEWTEFDEQKECMLLTKLPAELRNAIFELVFSTNLGIYEEDPEDVVDVEDKAEDTGDIAEASVHTVEDVTESNSATEQSHTKNDERTSSDEKPKNERPGHPLALLLTCRRIYQEASTLAFASHTFTTSGALYTTFYKLRLATSILSASQFSAITSLAFELGLNFIDQNRRASDFFSNSMLLFEGVKRLELRVKRRRILQNACHGYDSMGIAAITHPTRFAEPMREEAVRTYVPKWFHTALGDVLDGRAYAWQTGYKWQLEYPQWEYPEFVVYQDYSEARGWQMKGTMDSEHVGHVDGVEFCACGCGMPSWTFARFTQETGRKVEVEVLFYGDSERERERERRGLSVRLRPGAERLEGVKEVADGTGYQWKGADEYWDRLRNKHKWWISHRRRTSQG